MQSKSICCLGKPLMIVHGWPGSVWEFYKMIPMLTDPASYGGRDEDAFEVIAPSIPGYGFSEAPHRTGKKLLVAHAFCQKCQFCIYFDSNIRLPSQLYSEINATTFQRSSVFAMIFTNIACIFSRIFCSSVCRSLC